MKSHVTLAVVALLASSASFAQYRYVAPDGTVSYSDVPPEGKASQVTVKNLPLDAPLVAASTLPYALNQASTQFPVTLYTSASCASCDSARAYLKQRGVPFTEKTVGSDADLAVVKRISGDTAVPVVLIGSKKNVGFSPTTYAGLLDDAGYPATNLLPHNYSYPAPAAAAGAQTNPGGRSQQWHRCRNCCTSGHAGGGATASPGQCPARLQVLEVVKDRHGFVRLLRSSSERPKSKHENRDLERQLAQDSTATRDRLAGREPCRCALSARDQDHRREIPARGIARDRLPRCIPGTKDLQRCRHPGATGPADRRRGIRYSGL